MTFIKQDALILKDSYEGSLAAHEDMKDVVIEGVQVKKKNHASPSESYDHSLNEAC